MIPPVKRRIMPTIIADEIHGVAPMVGPSIAALKNMRYHDSQKDKDKGENGDE